MRNDAYTKWLTVGGNEMNKFEPQCKTQAELFERMARVCRMCEGTGISPSECLRVQGLVIPDSIYSLIPLLLNNPELAEFALAIVEGKPVWRDSVVFDKGNGTEFLAGEFPSSMYKATWNPPKRTKTVSIDGVVIGECPVAKEIRLNEDSLRFGWYWVSITYDRKDDRDQAEAIINKLLGG